MLKREYVIDYEWPTRRAKNQLATEKASSKELQLV